MADHHWEMGEKAIGFVDDDGNKKGSEFSGLPVLGTYSDLPELIHCRPR